MGPDWTPQKLNVDVGMPEELDVASMLSNGLQPGEETMDGADGADGAGAGDAGACGFSQREAGETHTAGTSALHGATGSVTGTGWRRQRCDQPLL